MVFLWRPGLSEILRENASPRGQKLAKVVLKRSLFYHLARIMVWILLLSIFTILAAGASIWGHFDDQRAIQSGQPTFETLASFTGIWDRNLFIQHLGEPDAQDRFTMLPGQALQLPRSRWNRLFDNLLLDLVCLSLAISSPLLWDCCGSVTGWLVAVAAAFQATGYGVAAYTTYQSGMWRKWLEEGKSR